jgi:hypothetical protein
MSPKSLMRYDGLQAATYARVARFISENYLALDEDSTESLIWLHESTMTDGIENGLQAATVGEMIAALEDLAPLPDDYNADEQVASEEIDLESALIDRLPKAKEEKDDDESSNS